MDLGVKNGTVRILEHDPKWADEASRMINHLKTFLTGDDFLDFEHVGSTAIKGIPAKPIVDIAVAIKDESVVEKYKDIMLENGFTFLGKVTDDNWMYHIGHKGQDDRTHHIHFVVAGTKRWILYLAFRDYLNANPDAAKRYADLKRSLSTTYANDRLVYRNMKDPLITQLDIEAMEWYKNNK